MDTAERHHAWRLLLLAEAKAEGGDLICTNMEDLSRTASGNASSSSDAQYRPVQSELVREEQGAV